MCALRVLLALALAVAILALLGGIRRSTRRRRPWRRRWIWRLRPRTPDDCLRCRLAAALLERRARGALYRLQKGYATPQAAH
jgi:hypothetical protein